MNKNRTLGFVISALMVGFSLPNESMAEIQQPTSLPSPRAVEPTIHFSSEKVFVADSKKTKTPIQHGLIIGGDRAINQVMIKDIRFSSQIGYERVVIDLEGTHNGETSGIPRPPYYQVEVSTDQKRIGISVWGRPELRFDSRKVNAVFKKSALIGNISLLPKVEDDVWTFVLPIKTNAQVEVFELSQPVRIIMDISLKKS